MMRTWVVGLVAAMAFGINGGRPLQGAAAAGQPRTEQSDPTTLVERLGDARYVVRERATSQLILRGVSAIDALQQGVQSPDREVRFRSRRALVIIQAEDFQRRLRAFAAGRQFKQAQQLPCWDEFRKRVGDGAVARRLFVEMQKSEPELLRTLANSPAKAYEVLAARLMGIQQEMNFRQASPASLGTVAAVLFIANSLDRAYPASLATAMPALFRQPDFVRALDGGAERTLLRKMLGRWIAKSEGWNAYQSLLLALQYNISQGLAPAKRVLHDAPNQANQPYYRYYALLTIGRFGSEADVPTVESFLKDTTQYGLAVPVARSVKYRTQIRDVALAVLIHLTRQDPKQFGLTRLQKHPVYLYEPNSLALENDQKRDEIIKKWHAFRESQMAVQSK